MKITFFGQLEPDKQTFYQQGLAGHEVQFIDQNLDEANIPDDATAEVISIFVQSKITAKVIDAFPNLKLITVRSTGFDNIDVAHATEKGIVVCNVPAYGSHTVAEFTFGLILSLSRKIPQAIAQLKAEGDFDHQGLRGFDLFGKTLGVVGTGKIGVNVIKIAQGFGMKVIAFDAFPNQELANTLQFQYLPLEQLLAESDIVTLHVPATPQTHHLLNAQNFPLLKKGSYVINTARGDVIETDALLMAIGQETVAGAGLDVLEGESEMGQMPTRDEHEPSKLLEVIADNLLIKNSKVIVTPHTAFYTTEAEDSIMKTTLENILQFVHNTPINIVKK